jgi:putative membrane protein
MKRPSWQIEGTEPDYRFSLANERTFLAWIRTALAVLAGGILLHEFGARFRPPVLLIAISTALILLAAFLSGAAYFQWKGNEIAMRTNKALPGHFAIPLLTIAMCCAASTFAVLVVIQ